MTAVGCVLDAKSLLGEGPLWDPQARVPYWVDIKRQPQAGGIFAFEPGVKGLPEAQFTG